MPQSGLRRSATADFLASRSNNGLRMLQIGLGTWQSEAGQVEKAVEEAPKCGYRHIDAAVIVRLLSLTHPAHSYNQFELPVRESERCEIACEGLPSGCGTYRAMQVAEGIERRGVAREDVFLVSKLWNSHRPECVEADLDNTLAQLGTTYLDLSVPSFATPTRKVLIRNSEATSFMGRPVPSGQGHECDSP